MFFNYKCGGQLHDNEGIFNKYIIILKEVIKFLYSECLSSKVGNFIFGKRLSGRIENVCTALQFQDDDHLVDIFLNFSLVGNNLFNIRI